MKSSRGFTSTFITSFFTLAMPILMAIALVSPATADLPPSKQKTVAVMVELNAAPAAVPYAAALKVAQEQADAARIYALAHPTLKSSKALLGQKPQQTQVSSSAAAQVQSVVKQLDQAQQAMLPSLTGANIGGQVLYRAQRSYNGIVMAVSPDKISAIAALPGVKAVHPMHPKFATTAFSDIDFLGVRTPWAKAPFGFHGENIKVAVIDSGLDYIHTNFGGPGSSGYAIPANHTSAPNAFFPSPKVPGGYDFAGDAYDANQDPGTGHDPAPDPDPFDCGGAGSSGGHGTACASLVAGYGVTNAGFTYSGSYDAANPAMSTLTISPGMAPAAKLYPLRVFGCNGSTNLVVNAIEYAMDPNGDGNFSDRVDVISMSLGSNEGYADDSDDIAASNAAGAGILVCSAAGNAGDSYYIHSSPAAASGTLGVAASFNDANGFIADSSVVPNTPGAGAPAAGKYYSIYGSASPHAGAGLTGNVVYAVPNNGNAAAFTNAANIAGNICLIDRGVTTFTDKIQKAFNAGAIGVIIDNFTQPTSPPIVMSTTGQPAIPAVMISKADRDTIVAASGGFNATTGVPTNPVNVTIKDEPLTTVTFATNPPGSAAGAGSPDTLPTYTSRGPRLPDSAVKPDITAPAEVTGVANHNTGNGFENFNGTSSATPHIAGIMALLRQLHPTWSVQELNALACSTATHDLATTVGGATKVGVGRIGAGRVDVTNASNANVVAYNGTDPNLIGVSFGVVEVPVDGSRTLTKAVKVVNKGPVDVTYNITYPDLASAAGTTFTGPAAVTVLANSSTTFNVTFTATGSALRHNADASVGNPASGVMVQATDFGNFRRSYLTEKNGYAVLTPASGSEPVLRVALYAAPKPTSAMHATSTGVVPDAASGSFTLNLSGAPINTGASFPTDIVSYAKAFELQYVSPTSSSTDANVIKYVGVTSDWVNQSAGGRAGYATTVSFGIEGFGNAALPEFNSSDKEVFIDLDFDNVYDAAVYLSSLPSGTAHTNVYFTFIFDITGFVTGTPGSSFPDWPTNGRSGSTTDRDTNNFNNSLVVVPADSLIATGSTSFQYQVVTFDRNGNEVDETPVLFFDAANPGLDATPAATFEPFFVNDLPTTSFTVNYNGTNFQTNGSKGVMVAHMHNGTGNRTDVVAFRKPTITSFTPTAAKVGQTITITGSNFGPGTVVTFFNNKPATTVNVITPNTLTAVVPAGAISGPIRVSNAAGFSSKGGFTVLP